IIPWRPVQSPAASDHGLVIEAVNRARSRGGLDCRLMPLHRRGAVLAGEDQTALDRSTLSGNWIDQIDAVVQRAHGILIETHGDLVAAFGESGFTLEADAVVQRQLVTHAPVVLPVR